MSAKTINMPVINAHAAGIDIGSREHWVAVGQGDKDVRVFGVYTEDYEQMSVWLKACNIQTIAMEATGTYWQTLYHHLECSGFKVMLCSPKAIKNPKGKSDKKDCRWLQNLHALGLLTASFVPEAAIERVRQYNRYRNTLTEQQTACTNRMHKCLQQMNVRLDVVLSDITGKSGMNIIKAILDGERDKHVLASFVDPNCKKSKEEIAAAINGNWREELLFQLRDQLYFYERIGESILAVEAKVELLLKEQNKLNETQPAQPIEKRKKAQKGQYRIDVQQLSCQYYGVDLISVEGVGCNTVMTLISEVGHDIKKFGSAKSFTSWLRITPNNRISGGKVMSSKTPKNRNVLGIAFRNAANTIAQRKNGILKAFFSRIAFKKGRTAAITATARKIATIIWTMIKKGTEYLPMNEQVYNEKIRKNALNNIIKNMKRLRISPEEIGLSLG